MLGLKADMLKHGIGREVFVCELASNAERVLRGEAKKAVYRGLKSVAEVGALARERWLVPRAVRRPEFGAWQRAHMEKLILTKRVEFAASEPGQKVVDTVR
jgi:hypothetical protein